METKTIVVVDDELDMSRFFRHVLEGRGYRVLTAADGRAGIETVMDARPDLVFLDEVMPLVHGREVCRYLKSREGLEKTKIVMVSSLPAKDLEGLHADGGRPDGYLRKPVGVREVLDAAERMLA